MAYIAECMNMGFALPVAKCDLDISIPQQGLINSIGVCGILVTSHFWGFMADTWGRQKVLRTALGCSFISCAISSLSVSSTMLMITRFIVGVT